jgi:hypothetical protein
MEKSLTKTGRTEIDKFVSDKSVLEIVDSILYLDTIKPYVELSQNGEVGEFLQKRNYPVIHTKTDFDYLYESLINRIDTLKGKDERVKTYLQRTEYQKQMAQLPVLMSKLEKISLDELKPKFKAVMEYVYDAVMNEGFDNMNYNHVQIKKDKKEISLVLEGKDGDRYGNSRFSLLKNKPNDLRVKIIRLVEKDTNLNFNQYLSLTIDDAIDMFKKFLLNPAKKGYLEDFTFQIRKIISIPTIMNNYLKKRLSSLDNVLKEINK